MGGFCKVFFLICCCHFLASSQAVVSVQCFSDYVAVDVPLNSFAFPINKDGLLLGSCPMSSFDPQNNIVTFVRGLLDCRFSRLVTPSQLLYSVELTYNWTGSPSSAFPVSIDCLFNKSASWTPLMPLPAGGYASGVGHLDFTMLIVNSDYTEASPSTTFFLGDPINLAASVDQYGHMPLSIFMDSCVAATTPVLANSSLVYPLINNHGCLIDGLNADSYFHRRVATSELYATIRAFRFTNVSSEVYIHCSLIAWDPAQLDVTKKACSYNHLTQGWEALDTPGTNSVCSCCSSVCTTRKRRDAGKGLKKEVVVGPLIIIPRVPVTDSIPVDNTSQPMSLISKEQAISWFPLVAPFLGVGLLGLLFLGVYLLYWRRRTAELKASKEPLMPNRSGMVDTLACHLSREY
ncbi:zona pellucida sperm-binding protein 3-like [Polypterus senegalus]|uniref:zona pellucida sperm-binding protein 3-like n=1 Tax=Polypterus senegalus TaxID=55291 RepID=UPI0019635A89|nr:zona pellucida sperm-binding protein 3-like [Polypterus senegalus]